ncbi:GAD1 Glutamate decarboxylase [Candida maltosa Xu316]|uniref:Glutamate decarboxylase n=1 Tax=Candida maltosa (strain Xu316) TaxID=1245528 RepID=M3JBK4_CANMX|nr:Glutamate decarboxylase, putative [Candida maltosa Xu316]
MVLSKHIDALKLESTILKNTPQAKLVKEQFIDAYDSHTNIPQYEIPNESSSEQLIYKYLSQELALDGNPTLNLASFVNTYVNDSSLRLINDNLTKNLADNDEYPSLIDVQTRCISILSNLWHAPYKLDPVTGNKVTNSIGTATTGSSEAIMLAGLALKKRWQLRRKAEGKSTANPNILMATCAQVALEKFAVYFDVENRLIPINEKSGHLIDVSKIKENIDENTIGIFVIMGSTFTGAFEPVEQISNLLDEVEKETGLDIRIHVDGASGGFVAPFIFPHLKWDFAIPRVDSINTSGHKFGLTSVGLGWVIWKDSSLLPKELRFSLDYLGGVEETFGLNFSRPGYPVITQYYNFLTLGRQGYAKVFDSCMTNARLLSTYLEASKYFEVLSVIHHKLTPEEKKHKFTREVDDKHLDSKLYTINEDFQPGLPVVAFRFSKELRNEYPELPQELFSSLLRKRGYIVPNYHLPPNEKDVEVLRVVVRNSLSLNLLEKLIEDATETVELLIRAAESVKEVVAKENPHSEKENRETVHRLLAVIASGGVAEVKEEQEKAGKHPNKKEGHVC